VVYFSSEIWSLFNIIYTIVEISTEGYIKIVGKQTEYVGPSPWEVGYPDSLKKYVRPAISKRYLTFELER
jgi:3',5'-cyclic-AMP phosphodiesterase